ncbi:ROK family transcriptional regulator [Actinoalloteichus sp. AHMU CJ021]|uniref:Sugar kinase of the NBD/HSP70 family, may containing an N-terminal HTH domain n=1 Tax=Actinoalloteichus caeruleus DSM 43889 TaxID=1120930 RepID=A0ABT1JPL8_ACTCY|nr:ROK family transcriptional regulator [Actinoalloteichus sp. AHMU CJ021]MCP2333626.1 Sugar kinase of the NBD/HSP70 family, may containing an N-terminal HTH domain [Actinoalloteichus caeruleus DSM 43889]
MRNGHVPPADQAGLRRANLALVVRTLREHGQQSRAQLSALSGLSKATVSNLVSELESRRLVRAAGLTAGRQGRPGQLVELSPGSVCGIGLEINLEYLRATVLDLAGTVVTEQLVPLRVVELGPQRCLDQLAELARSMLATVAAVGAWPAGITVAVPGLVDTQAGVVRFAPNLRWRQIALVDGLAARVDLPLERCAVDNDANLAALAEHTSGAASGTDDLLCIVGSSGVGAGLLAAGVPVRGASGFAGEVGHLSLDPLGPSCPCGNRGCWERQIDLGTLLEVMSSPDDPVRDPSLAVSDRLRIIRVRAEAGDRRTLDALQQVGDALGVGLALLINVLNPAAVVLGGYFAELYEWLVEHARIQIASRVLSPEAARAAILPSTLGFTAAIRGGAQHAMRMVMDNPTLAPVVASEPTEAPA